MLFVAESHVTIAHAKSIELGRGNSLDEMPP